MKLYQTHFNCNQPSLQQVTIPNYSTASIGVQVEKNGETISLSTSDATLVNGTDVISADSIYADHLTFPFTTGSENEDKEYTLSVRQADKEIVECDILLSAYASTAGYGTVSESLSSMVGKSLKAISVTPISAMVLTSLENNYCYIVDGSGTFKYSWRGPKSKYNPQDPAKWMDNNGFYDDVVVQDGWSIMSRTYLRVGDANVISIKQSKTIEGQKANFKLRVNSDKSSVIDSFKETSRDDVKEIMAENTFVLSGTYADSTTFSFTVPKVN